MLPLTTSGKPCKKCKKGSSPCYLHGDIQSPRSPEKHSPRASTFKIHKYYEEEDVTEYHPLNPDLIKFIEDRGWTILEKIGEGSTADVFSCKMNNVTAAIIFFSNVFDSTSSFYNIDSKIEQVRQFPKIFPIVYDTFKTSIPYSTDKHYLRWSGPSEVRTIQVVEKVDMTLDKYYAKLNSQEKTSVKNTVKQDITNYLKILKKNGICYPDLKPDNIGVIIVKGKPVYKFIDIEGIWTVRENGKEILTYKACDIESSVASFLEFGLRI